MKFPSGLRVIYNYMAISNKCLVFSSHSHLNQFFECSQWVVWYIIHSANYAY